MEYYIIFSDKEIKFQNSGNIDIDWRRWFKSAIQESAKQAWGAEKRIKENPNKLFLDVKCTEQLPIDIPNNKVNYHIVLVTHGVTKRCAKELGGSGSLEINSNLKGISSHTTPFQIGDLDPGKTFVHVLDDVSLDILMNTLDTIYDFVSYLKKKETLIRSIYTIQGSGEEDLLAHYLKKVNARQEHNFIFSSEFKNQIIPKGLWIEFEKHPNRIAQKEKNKISYMWDRIIETFNQHALHATSSTGLNDTENIMRFMASESRFHRRVLSHNLKNILDTTPPDESRLNIIPPLKKGYPWYVFLLWPKKPGLSNNSYMLERRRSLENHCYVTRLEYPDAKYIVGIAIRAGNYLELIFQQKEALILL